MNDILEEIDRKSRVLLRWDEEYRYLVTVLFKNQTERIVITPARVGSHYLILYKNGWSTTLVIDERARVHIEVCDLYEHLTNNYDVIMKLPHIKGELKERIDLFIENYKEYIWMHSLNIPMLSSIERVSEELRKNQNHHRKLVRLLVGYNELLDDIMRNNKRCLNSLRDYLAPELVAEAI